MGCGASTPAAQVRPEAERGFDPASVISGSAMEHIRSARIDSVLDDAASRAGDEHALLLLGRPSSGKSTLFLQFRQLYSHALDSPKARASYRGRVVSTMLTAMRELADTALAKELLPPHLADDVIALRELRDDESGVLSRAGAEIIERLWADAGVRKVFSSHEPSDVVNFSVSALFDRVATLAGADYVPTLDDTLRIRQVTTSARETTFETEGVRFRVTDVGGQRALRRRWINYFDRMEAVLFVAAMEEYEWRHGETGEGTLLDAAVDLFDETINHPALAGKPVVLFLNKVDLFCERFNPELFCKSFPGFDPSSTDAQLAADQVAAAFLSRLKSTDKRQVWTHCTTALDASNVAVVFNAVRHSIIDANLRLFGLK